ncbi:ATP-binding protein [Desulfatirhabdium butyrativorans]|uniref:ATP-binding protein n=1 Tax=Desulfatirhabdium butyrativorans TaxID=340467 RepID=UPI00041B6FFB|nr:ATP-binding protein [Desulfatirhabdium butyrativorans]
MNILIAEDDGNLRAMLSEFFHERGYGVFEAADGQSALDLFQEYPVQIVLLDWRLPVLGGKEVCLAIRSKPMTHYAYLIVMTGDATEARSIEARECGADDYLAKPFDLEALMVRVKSGERIIRLEERYIELQDVLMESRNSFRSVLDVLYEEILAVDRNFEIILVNQAYLKQRGLRFVEVFGKSGLSEGFWFFDSGLIDFIKAETMAAFDTAKSARWVRSVDVRKAGHLVYEIQFLPIPSEQGSVAQVVIVLRNVTEAHLRREKIVTLNQRLQQTLAELNTKNETLEKTLSSLKETQAQMIQSEKMASIGQLAAGIAHEINNPVGFVTSNMNTLGNYVEELKTMVMAYRRALRDAADPQCPGGLLDGVFAGDAERDVDFILEDLPQLVQESREGLERIRKIVLDLKDFAHPGEDTLKLVDLNRNIDSTLNIVWNEIKYKAVVHKDYGDLPQVNCYSQQINQVFMNLLVNAAQAIAEKGEIRICTRAEGESVVVAISDTGCGIPPEQIGRIFDPFFTTKPVGKGTGLGLNVVYNVVCKHGGKISVESSPGKGTTFTVRLPVNGPETQTGDAHEPQA